MAIGDKYLPDEIESKWYGYWLDNQFFHSEPDEREPYTVVIPPPNVTGVLHMGHMLNNTIQDILVRRARMQGKNACWVPGTDHASIATEAKVVAKLAAEGVKKTDLTREHFLEHAWDWTHKHGGIILEQLKKLGCSCDWERTCFTMDEKRSQSVLKVFVDLYNKGLIYRGVRMVNWDPAAQTALSDEEVNYKEQQGSMYYLRYQVTAPPSLPKEEDVCAMQGGYGGGTTRTSPPWERLAGSWAVIATTRPETIMGDTAMCINPNNPKTAWLKGKRVIVPLVNREIPVIEDDYVDMEFGTGCLKVTPAHDINDYMLGEKYHLPSIDIFNDDGTLNENGAMYAGMERFECRKKIVKDLEEAGWLEKVEPYTNKVGFSERTDVPIEPKLSMQWFLKMEALAKPALEAVENGTIQFYPAKFKNTYRHWMENIKDWCISRQLWWGHRIPAWYIVPPLPSGGGNIPDDFPVGSNAFVVAENEEEARQKAIAKFPLLGERGFSLRQDEDCLDTWFSSWLWPVSVFDGINRPDNRDINYYYPTNDLVTAPEIIFFWVARMIISGYEYRGKECFKNVYFTGIVRDKLGRKMSKSLGNSPDPIELMNKYGADGVRTGMLLTSPAGNDLPFDEALCEQGRNFCNKIWNAFRLVNGWSETGGIKVDDRGDMPKHSGIAVEWFANLLEDTKLEVEDLFSKYRLSEALMLLYKLFWDDFCSWYLEIVKPEYGTVIDAATHAKTKGFFEDLLKILHPFVPFITEELYQALYPRKADETVMVAFLERKKLSTSRQKEQRNKILADFERTQEIVTHIRNIRKQKNILNRESLNLHVIVDENFPAEHLPVICKMGNIAEVKAITEKDPAAASFLVKTTEYFVPLSTQIDTGAEIEKLETELAYLEGFLALVMKKLGNERFVAGAPARVVETEHAKRADAEAKIGALRQRIAALRP